MYKLVYAAIVGSVNATQWISWCHQASSIQVEAQVFRLTVTTLRSAERLVII